MENPNRARRLPSLPMPTKTTTLSAHTQQHALRDSTAGLTFALNLHYSRAVVRWVEELATQPMIAERMEALRD